MKLVDLTSQIAQELADASAKGMVSGTTGNMHLPVTTENGNLLVVVVPLQQGPSAGAGYGTPTWGPAATDQRSENYHDPYRPGSVMTDTDGTEYVWVAEQGFVPASSVSGGSAVGNLATAAYKALDALVGGIQAKK